VPIFANVEVLTEASILIPSEEDEDRSVERFKEFLDR
jgi:bifunctional DNase/RNase